MKPKSHFKRLAAHVAAGEIRAAETLATKLTKSGAMPTAYLKLEGLLAGRTTRKANKRYVRTVCRYAH